MPLFLLLLISAVVGAQEIPAVYGKYCAACHADSATGTDRGPGLIDTRSLRSRSEAQIRGIIRNGTRGGMPAFPLADGELDALAKAVRSWNASAFDAHPAGDLAAGKALFEAKCLTCHMAMGRGGSNGPDLSGVAKELTVRELDQTLSDPNSRKGKRNGAACPSWAFCPDDPWGVVAVRLKNGSSLRGFARSQGAHDVQLQTFDGKLHLLTSTDYAAITREASSYMPAFSGSAAERKDLMAYLSTLGGTSLGPISGAAAPSAAAVASIQTPKAGEWPGYHGLPSANRHSPLAQITVANASRLKPAWSYALPHPSLQTTPLVADGVMYVTAP